MYVDRLRLKNIRLFRDLELSFRRHDESTRLWTVILGGNGLCKTTILQTIALAASGPTLAGILTRKIGELRRFACGEEDCTIEVDFERLPTAPAIKAPDFNVSPDRISVRLERPNASGQGAHEFKGDGTGADVVRELRSSGASGFLVLGYGVGRNLPDAGELIADPSDRALDRVGSLFDKRHKLLGLDFYERLKKQRAHRDFARLLLEVLQDESDQVILPWLDVERLVTSPTTAETPKFDELMKYLEVRKLPVIMDGERFDVPFEGLPHGYQTVLAWIGDLIGHALLDSDAKAQGLVSVRDIHAIVLLDEIDQHLHPAWQPEVIPYLRKVLPKVQFIVTTHSPIVVNGVDADEVIGFRMSGGELTPIRFDGPSPGLMSATEVLRRFFDAPHSERPELLAKRREYLDLLATSKRTAGEELRLSELKKELGKYLA